MNNSFVLISTAGIDGTSYLAETASECRDASDLAAFNACKAAYGSVTLGQITAQPCRVYPPVSDTLALFCNTVRDKVEYRVTGPEGNKRCEIGFQNAANTAWVCDSVGHGSDTQEAMRRCKAAVVSSRASEQGGEDRQMLGE
jgi:hypothetical protein